MTTTTEAEMPTEEDYDAAIERLGKVFRDDAETFIGLLESVRDEETVHLVAPETGKCTADCAGCLAERVADAVTRAVVGGESWIVPKIPHDETVAVTPRILPGGLIVSSEGASDPDHARHYAAQLLAAADTSEGMTLRSDA